MNRQPFPDIAPWPPQRWTPPLLPGFPSAFDGYASLFDAFWQAAFGYRFEPWQADLLRHMLEVYPEGHARAGELRFRQVVISLGRQNGKTEIAAALGLWGLLARRVPVVVGIASSADQARLVYKRTMRAIKGTPSLERKFKALTETRGIKTLDGGSYEIKAAKSASLQGIPIDVGIVDELHLLSRDLWFDLVNGLGGRPNCLVAGITTAGDDNSELLLELYEQGARAIERGAESRTAFYCWEGLNAARPDDDAELGRELARANPSVASGRRDLEIELGDVREQPEPDAIRYRINRFVGATNVFISGAAWGACQTSDPFPTGVQPIFTFDRTPDWSYASVGAFAKMPDGRIYCDLVASLVRPTIEQLADVAVMLSKHNPATFGVDGYALRDLGRRLEDRGLPVTYATQADALNGSALFYSKVTQRKLAHPGHPLMAVQIPKTVRKNVRDGFRVSRADSGGQIDVVMNHVLGVQLAETQREIALQIF
ncbi:terminase large subunit domain-containing protein [Microbacterium sp. KNMS]